MNILIISSNRNKQPLAVMPIGACIVAESLKQAGHQVKLIDLMFETYIEQKTNEAMRAFNPGVIGISIRNIDNNDMKNPKRLFEDAALLVQCIRKYSDALIVIGGSAVSVLPEQLLRYTKASYAVIKNGETIFSEMVSVLERKQDQKFKKLPHVAWIDDTGFHVNESSGSISTEFTPAPDFHQWIDVNEYLARLSTVPVQTKRGCPYDCVYCTYAIHEGKRYQLCDTDTVVNHIKRLVEQGIFDIEFVDNVFNAPYSHALELCKGISRAKLPVRLMTMELNPRFVDEPLITAMEDAGFVGVGITAESADDGVLAGLKKDYSADTVKQAARMLNKSRIPCFWIFLLGGPGETKDSVMRTFEFAKKHIRPADTVFFNAGIRVYPGTGIETIARQQGVLHKSPNEMLEPVFYLSPQLDPDWLTRALRQAVAENGNFIFSESLSLPYFSAGLRIAHLFGIRQPIWKHARLIKRGLQLIGAHA